MKRYITVLCLTLLVLTGACAPATPTETPPQPTETQTDDLSIKILFPTATNEFEMGQSIKSIIQVSDPQGNIIPDAQVTLSIKDAAGQEIIDLPAAYGAGAGGWRELPGAAPSLGGGV